MHGVEYVANLLQVGPAEIYQARSTKKSPITIPAISAAAAVFTIRRGSILRAIPGVQLVEMERNRRWAWCCGGGGGVPEADPELAQWSAADRMREARASGAELILTSSALCQRSFADLQEARLAGPRPARIRLSGALDHAERTSFHAATDAVACWA